MPNGQQPPRRRSYDWMFGDTAPERETLTRTNAAPDYGWLFGEPERSDAVTVVDRLRERDPGGDLLLADDPVRPPARTDRVEREDAPTVGLLRRLGRDVKHLARFIGGSGYVGASGPGMVPIEARRGEPAERLPTSPEEIEGAARGAATLVFPVGVAAETVGGAILNLLAGRDKPFSRAYEEGAFTPLARLTGLDERLERLAEERPLTAAGIEAVGTILTGGATEGLVRSGARRAAQRVGRAIDIGEDVARGIREGVAAVDDPSAGITQPPPLRPREIDPESALGVVLRRLRREEEAQRAAEEAAARARLEQLEPGPAPDPFELRGPSGEPIVTREPEDPRIIRVPEPEAEAPTAPPAEEPPTVTVGGRRFEVADPEGSVIALREPASEPERRPLIEIARVLGGREKVRPDLETPTPEEAFFYGGVRQSGYVPPPEPPAPPPPPDPESTIGVVLRRLAREDALRREAEEEAARARLAQLEPAPAADPFELRGPSGQPIMAREPEDPRIIRVPEPASEAAPEPSRPRGEEPPTLQVGERRFAVADPETGIITVREVEEQPPQQRPLIEIARALGGRLKARAEVERPTREDLFFYGGVRDPETYARQSLRPPFEIRGLLPERAGPIPMRGELSPEEAIRFAQREAMLSRARRMAAGEPEPRPAAAATPEPERVEAGPAAAEVVEQAADQPAGGDVPRETSTEVVEVRARTRDSLTPEEAERLRRINRSRRMRGERPALTPEEIGEALASGRGPARRTVDLTKLTDDQLREKYKQYVRGLINAEQSVLEAAPGGRERVATNTWGERLVVGGVGGRKADFAVGRRTQAKQRVDAARRELERRGLPVPRDEEAYQNVKPRDLLPDNREWYEGLKSQPDEALLDIRGGIEEQLAQDRSSIRLLERWYLAQGEILRRGLDEYGRVPQVVVEALARTGVTAAGGAAAGAAIAPEDQRGAGAVAGAAAAVGGPRLLRRLLGRGGREAARPAYLEDPAVKGVLGTIATGEKERPGGIVQRLTELATSTKRGAERLYQKVVNEMYGLERFGREVGGEEAGKRLGNLAVQATGWRSAATARLEREFRDVLRAAKGHEEGAAALAKAERIIELAEAGIKEVPEERLREARQVVARLSQVPEVRQAVDRLRAYYRSLLDHKLANGSLTRESYDAIIARGHYYVPLLPEEIAEARVPTSGGGKLAPRTSGVRRMRSDQLGTDETVDPFKQAIIDTFEAERTVARQRVTNALAAIVDTDPEAAAPFVRRLEGDQTARTGREVRAVVQGKQQRYEVLDEDLYESWAAMAPETQNIVVRLLSIPKRVLQVGVTALPDFAIANAIRDNFMAAVQYRPNVRGAVTGAGAGAAAGAAADDESPVRGALLGAVGGAAMGGAIVPQLARTLAALRDITGLAGGNRAIYEEWMRAGGPGFGYYARDPKDAGKLLNALRREGVKPSDILMPKNWWHALQAVNRAVEEAPRLARYKHLRAEGADIPEAVAGSRDISVNFLRRGSDPAVQGLAAVTAFLNPKIQGWDKLVRMLRDPKTWAMGVGAITAPSIALWHVNKDNPDYWQRPQWERNLFWLIPKDDGGFWRIPKPFEVGFIFASVPERFLDYLYQRDPETLTFALKDMLSTTFEGTFPIPTAVEPFLENAVNFDFFRNRPVVAPGLERLPDELQYDENTSSVGVALGRLLNASPQKIDNVLLGLTGSTGREALELTSRAARAAGLDTRPEPAAGRRMLVGRFETQEGGVSDAEMTVRRRFERAEKVRNALMELVERGDQAAALRYAQQNRQQLMAYMDLKPRMDALREAADLRRRIHEAPHLNAAQKREALTQLNRMVVALLQFQPEEEAPEGEERGQRRERPRERPGGKRPAFAEPAPTR